MFKNIKCRDNFTLNGIEAPYLPMIINLQLSLEERTLYDVNQYIRSFVVDEKGVGRAKRVATSLCSFLNWFYTNGLETQAGQFPTPWLMKPRS